MNTTPLAVPGRWRVSTRPATDTPVPCGSSWSAAGPLVETRKRPHGPRGLDGLPDRLPHPLPQAHPETDRLLRSGPVAPDLARLSRRLERRIPEALLDAHLSNFRAVLLRVFDER